MTLARSTGQVQRRHGKPVAAVDMFGASKNLLINGGFQICQRGSTITAATTYANDDDGYTLDRWIVLSDGNDIVDVGCNTSEAPTGSYACVSLDVETGNKQCGILQVIETANCQSIIGSNCSLSFEAKIAAGSTSIDHLRAAVIAWDGAADTVTSDIVSAWNGAGSNPTLVANWTFENTPASLGTLTTSYQKFSIENIQVDTASTTNVGVFIWVDDVTLTVGHIVYIANVQLEAGPYVTPFEHRFFQDELRRCQRYFCKTFNYDTAPAGNAGRAGCIAAVAATAANNALMAQWRYPVVMRTTPTVTLYDPISVVTSNWENIDGADPDYAITANSTGDASVAVQDNADGVFGGGDRCFVHATADAEL